MIRMYSVEKVLVLLVVRKVESTLALALARPPLTHQLVDAVLCFSLRRKIEVRWRILVILLTQL